MQSIYKAVSDFLASLFPKGKPEIQKPKDEPPEGYKALYFKCWLCTGHNKFACKPFEEEKKFTIECSWCGVDNVVTVATPEN
jgi:transcription elongation factor Elf1